MFNASSVDTVDLDSFSNLDVVQRVVQLTKADLEHSNFDENVIVGVGYGRCYGDRYRYYKKFRGGLRCG